LRIPQQTLEVEFFIYGGLVLTDEQVIAIHSFMSELRRDLGLRPDQSVKFSSHARPEHVRFEDWTAAKRAILQELLRLEVRFMAYAVHHSIAAGQSVQRRNEFALNTILWGFHKLLEEVQDHGMVTVDEPDLEGRIVIGNLLNRGLEIDGREVRLPRIVSYGRSHVDWTHCLSACDVLLGSFRYCVNHPDRAASAEMFPVVARLLHHRERDGVAYIREHGLFLRPLQVRVDGIRRRYDNLTRNLETLLSERQANR